MKRTSDQTALMIRYLLGDVPEEEQVRLETEFFTDEECYQQLVALEDELRYDYAQGNLIRRDRELFEKRFLITAADRERVALAKSLMDRALEESARHKPAERAAKPSLWQTFREFLTIPVLQPSFAPVAVAVAIALALGLLYETLHLRNQLDQMQARRANEQQSAQATLAQQREQQKTLKQELDRERNRRQQLEGEVSKTKQQMNFLAFVLAPGLTRDVEGPKRLMIPSGTDSVRLQMDLNRRDAHRRYRASLQTLDGEELWSQDVPSTGATVVVTLPGRVLRQGDYVVDLKGIGPAGALEQADDYYFTVVGQ